MGGLIFFLVLLVIGYLSGRTLEKRHFRSIIEREQELAGLMTFCKRFPPETMAGCEGKLVGGNVVISIDYFKMIAASLRTIVGGRISAYESLLERARREAILRMKEEARNWGANTVINVKLETSSIYRNQQQIGSVEVYAYGTALKPA